MTTFRFRDFELDVATCELRRAGHSLRIERQPMDLLILLVERRHELVSRDDIVKRLWGERAFVDVEMGVNTAVRKVRLALGDSPENPTFIQTLPARGYRFLPEVELLQSSREVNAPPRVRLAVLPFDNIGTDPAREYFADGLTEEAIVALGQIDPERLTVIGRTSVMAYKRTTKALEQIGRELDVEYLVEGAVRAEGPRLRVTTKLIRVRDQSQVWSLSFDSESGGLLEFQRELSTSIAEKIALQVAPGRLDSLSRRQTRDAEAYDLYLRGRYYWNQLTPPTTRRALEYYLRATERDPRYALAWSGVADAHASAPINGDAPPLEAAERAHAAARRAEAADAQLAEVQTSLGNIQLFLDWNWPAAEAHYRRAIALDPSYALGHRMLGVVLTHRGRHEGARAAMRRARELDIYAMHYSLSAMIEIHARNPDAAVSFARQATVIAPDFWIGHYHLSHAYEHAGELDLALDAATTAGRLGGSNSKAIGTRGYLLAKLGRQEEACAILAGLESIARERFVPPYGMALTLLGLGEHQRALECLERGQAVRDVGLMFLPVDPKWDTLRSQTRFSEILRRCGFERSDPGDPPGDRGPNWTNAR
ncbi:MAG TPA: winged helix-turn-helix domain-containing protein [Steroidobacteraceae bacterium]|nr:winged helix-turn-helix domain-containing protein [Steroidobacteraceae bacterium]